MRKIVPSSFFRVHRSLPKGLILACVFTAGPVMPQSIDIGTPDCRHGVRLLAQGARLDDVLRQLARSLDFKLDLDGPLPSVVYLDSEGPVASLVARVLARESFMMLTQENRRCPGQTTVSQLFVVASATSGASASSSAPVRRQAANPLPALQPTSQAAELTEMYLQSHRAIPIPAPMQASGPLP